MLDEAGLGQGKPWVVAQLDRGHQRVLVNGGVHLEKVRREAQPGQQVQAAVGKHPLRVLLRDVLLELHVEPLGDDSEAPVRPLDQLAGVIGVGDSLGS